MEYTYLNFQFPHFGLSVCHTESKLISSRFFNPIDHNKPYIEGMANDLTSKIEMQLREYLVNPCFKFDLPYDLIGTDHQLKVWHTMQAIQSGDYLTYGDVAKKINSAPRAVGGACGKNPLPIIVPCHRIIAANKGLGGFNSGNIFFNLGIKKWLLEHEGILLKYQNE